VNLFNSFSAKIDLLIISDRGHFLNIATLNGILFSHLTHFGKLSFFNFRPSFLSPDGFRSIGCIGCKLIFLADVVPGRADEIDDGNEAVMFPSRGTTY